MTRCVWAFLLTALLCLAIPARGVASLASEHGWEIVTIEGRAFPAAFHVAVEDLALFRVSDGKTLPIPFQIDERDGDGRIALPDGPEPSRDERPGTFDDNDLLVFAVRDLGERGRVAGAAEIRVRDPRTDVSGWAYLRLGGARAPVRDVVRYDPDIDTVYARRYALAFGRHTTSYFAFVGAGGVPGRNLLDRVKARITFRLFGGIFTFHRTEQDLTSNVIAWKNGPIRVIRRVRIRTRIGYGLPEPEVIADTIFTDDTFQSPATVHIPFDLRYVVGSLTLRTFMDFDGLNGARLFTVGQGPTPIGCGLPPLAANGRETDWFGITAPEGTFVQDLMMSPALASVQRHLYAVADPRPDPPERVPGNCPGVGYIFTHFGGIGRGTYWSNSIVRAFEQYSPRDVGAFLDSRRHPLEVAAIPSGSQ